MLLHIINLSATHQINPVYIIGHVCMLLLCMLLSQFSVKLSELIVAQHFHKTIIIGH